MTAETVMTMMMPVPRSGWATIMSSGAAPISRSRLTSYIVSPSGRRWQYVAKARMRKSTVNSLGWTWMKPRLYQRWAPRALWPRTKTPASPSKLQT